MKPIRVLQVVTHMNRGGLETMLMNFYRHIDREKVQFDFLVHREQRAAYDDEIEALGGKIYRLPRLVPWSVSYRKALDEFFAQHPEYRVVHVHQDCLSAVILKAAARHGVPVRIAHSHSSNQDKNLKYPIKLFYKRFIPRYATALFACGKDAGDWMFGGSVYTVVNNAIDTAAYSFDPIKRSEMRKTLGISQDTLVIGHVGRFSPAKNHAFLIDIFSEIHCKMPDSCLLLVGDGELRPQIQEKVSALGLEQAVIFTGVRGDIPELLQVMDAFAFPSLYEGTPVSLVEAQAAGLPCVISENVPDDVCVTGLIRKLPLTLAAEHWAEQICALAGGERQNVRTELAGAGFDIKENAKWLEKYYLGEWE